MELIKKIDNFLTQFENNGKFSVDDEDIERFKNNFKPAELLTHIVDMFVEYPNRNHERIIHSITPFSLISFRAMDLGSKEKIITTLNEIFSFDEIEENDYNKFFIFDCLPQKDRVRNVISGIGIGKIYYVPKKEEKVILELYKKMAILIAKKSLNMKIGGFHIEFFTHFSKILNYDHAKFNWGSEKVRSILKKENIDILPSSDEIKDILCNSYLFNKKDFFQKNILEVSDLKHYLYLLDEKEKNNLKSHYYAYYEEKANEMMNDEQFFRQTVDRLFELKWEIEKLNSLFS